MKWPDDVIQRLPDEESDHGGLTINLHIGKHHRRDGAKAGCKPGQPKPDNLIA